MNAVVVSRLTSAMIIEESLSGIAFFFFCFLKLVLLQNFREMIPLLGVFRILVIVIIGRQTFCIFISFIYFPLLLSCMLCVAVGVDFGFAFYRRFAGDEGAMKVRAAACCVFAANPNDAPPARHVHSPLPLNG